MSRGRPVKCPYCGKTRTIGKGYRTTATMGFRRLRKCKACGRRFTVKSKRILRPEVH